MSGYNVLIVLVAALLLGAFGWTITPRGKYQTCVLSESGTGLTLRGELTSPVQSHTDQYSSDDYLLLHHVGGDISGSAPSVDWCVFVSLNWASCHGSHTLRAAPKRADVRFET